MEEKSWINGKSIPEPYNICCCVLKENKGWEIQQEMRKLLSACLWCTEYENVVQSKEQRPVWCVLDSLF